MYINLNIYMYIYLCVSVCVHDRLNDKATFCLYNHLKILSSFLIMSWFQVEIAGGIYQNCSKRFRTFYRPSSPVACMCIMNIL